ncbi:MAG: hypothetical protein EBT97_09480, partial [Actinobacteria bacterium]|nr:hypothetical protein [Actinomycetota bacterium]
AAESWSTNADRSVYTFKLRPNLKWSDGTPLTSADFVYSMRRLLSGVSSGSGAFIHGGRSPGYDGRQFGSGSRSAVYRGYISRSIKASPSMNGFPP